MLLTLRHEYTLTSQEVTVRDPGGGDPGMAVGGPASPAGRPPPPAGVAARPDPESGGNGRHQPKSHTHVCPPTPSKAVRPLSWHMSLKQQVALPRCSSSPRHGWQQSSICILYIYISPMCTYCNESHRVSYILYDKGTVYLYTRQHAAEPVRLFDKHKGFTCSHLNLYDHSFLGLYRDCEPNGFPAWAQAIDKIIHYIWNGNTHSGVRKKNEILNRSDFNSACMAHAAPIAGL